MKKFLTALLALGVMATTASAQMRTAYFMEGSYFRTEMNPALAPTRGFIALPALSGIGLSLNNNFLSVDNFLFNRGGQTVTALHGAVTADDFLGKLPNVNTVGLDADINILGVGFHNKWSYWTFGINARVQSDISLSKDVFAMLKSLGNNRYDLNKSGLAANAYAEIYVGASVPILDFVTVGARVKGLVGMANISAEFDQMYAEVGTEQVVGALHGNMRAAGPLFGAQYNAGDPLSMDGILDLNNALTKIKSGGFAVDLGAEVRLLDDHLKVSAAVTDLGFIKWHGSSIACASVKGDFRFEGIDLGGEETKPKIDGKFSGTMTAPDPKGYTTMLNCNLNVGVEYNILNNWIAFGLLSHTEFRPTNVWTELTASVNFRLGRSFTTTFSHTFLEHNKAGVLGFALNAHPAGFNLFLGMDYIGLKYAPLSMEGLPFAIPVPTTMKSFNFYFGMGFNLGKAKYMKSMQK